MVSVLPTMSSSMSGLYLSTHGNWYPGGAEAVLALSCFRDADVDDSACAILGAGYCDFGSRASLD